MSRNKIGNASLQQFDINLYSQVLDKIYTNVNFQKIRYQLLNNKSYLDEIKNSKHYITSHFQGYNYLLAFFIINNIKYNLLIMKNLKYRKDQNNPQDIKIYKFDANIDNNLYNNLGTIFDGKIINSTNNKSSFIIHDVYILNGKNIESLTLPEKLENINNILNKIKVNENHNFDCKVCRLYNFPELPDLIFNKLKTTELKINGLMFLPEYTGKYYIYTNDNEFDELKNNTNNNVTISIKKNNSSEIEFYMKKTNVPDVYELYDTDESSLIKEGIAHIPNIKTSHYFKNIFEDKNMIKINCIKSDKFNKWVPICNDYIQYSEAIF